MLANSSELMLVDEMDIQPDIFASLRGCFFKIVYFEDTKPIIRNDVGIQLKLHSHIREFTLPSLLL